MANLPPQMMNQGMPQGQGPMGGIPPVDQLNQGEPGMADEPPIQILAHFMPEELAYLDEMMGGANIDPETNLRDYTPLEPIMEQPEVQDIFAEAADKMQNEKPEMRQGFAEGGYTTSPPINEPGRPIDPELESLREMGEGKDTELAIITPKLADIFSEFNGGKMDINPDTGFPQFGNIFKEALRIAGPVVGAFFGGPIGGAIGGFAASKLTGQSTGASLKNAGIGAALPFAASAIGGAMGVGGAGAGLAGAAGTSMPIVGANTIGNMYAGFGPGYMGMTGAGAGAAGAGAGGLGGVGSSLAGGLGSILSSKYLPMAGIAGLTYMGHREDQKRRKEEEERARASTASALSQFNKPLKIRTQVPYVLNPNKQSEEDFQRGRAHPQYIPQPGFNVDPNEHFYAEGGPIVGPGNGQQDLIPKDVQKNSYIIDASTVSDLGDGSTQAGFRQLDQYFSRLPKNNMPQASHGGFIKAMVSDGEYEVPAQVVSSIGHGSNEMGAKILKTFIDNVRSQKRRSGDQLPPKAKSVGGYLKQMRAM